jgi:hypothetical protein
MTVTEITSRAGAIGCACLPGRVCAECDARGYESGLAGYAERIYPQLITPADEARERGVHYVSPEAEAEAGPYDSCELCGIPVRWRDAQAGWATMIGANAECYGRR